ncbi:MAG: hypothetical protein LBL90_05940 [Prevotellaceae bacterium]|jgi:hypothetical protein|nr:hypothetical protein [Prevotellaceae bacterium]
MTVRKIISPFLILLYLSAVIGLGFYYCHCERSERLVLLTYEHCDCAHKSHSHNNTCEKSACEHSAEGCDTGDACCQVVYKSIKIDQENSVQKAKNTASPLFLITAVLPPLIDVLNENDANNSFDFNKAPPESLKTPLIYQNCQLRL